ncbi:MAG: hypothetical protein J7539_18445 [Niabella sp.]|nr:hypothetical protein [Niabella sp.]
MLQTIIRTFPHLIIVAATLYYLIGKKSWLGVLLFVSSLTSTIVSVLQMQEGTSLSVDFAAKLHRMALLGNISFITYTVFAISFLILMIRILKPNATTYPFLDESVQDNNA